MAYLDILESSQTWTCPKTGYYQVICVGGGGGGGGAGFHFTGALFTPEYYRPEIYDTHAMGFKSPTDGFISSSKGGGNGGNGGSTSFGSLLTALGGDGGQGGGGELGSTLQNAHLSPKGGESLFSSGGSGIEVSCNLNYGLSSYYNDPDNHIEVFNTLNAYSPYYGNSNNDPVYRYNSFNPEGYIGSRDSIMFGNPDGVLSAVSGAGGAGGEIKTKTLYITKGTQISCSIGNGGSIGTKGGFTQNTIAKTNVYVNQSDSSYIVGNTIKYDTSMTHSIYLLAKVLGGGGGGGFTFEHSGGIGSEMVSEPLFSALIRTKYHYCNAFKESTKNPTGNGGKFSRGLGYGAGGSGGSIDTRVTMGIVLSKEAVLPTGAQGTIAEFSYEVVTSDFGGNDASFSYYNNSNTFRKHKLLTKDHCIIDDATSGANGVIVVREVS